MSFADKKRDGMFTDENKVLDSVELLLTDQSYHIEFNGFLTNHVKHAVVALKGLGASPQRIKEYYDIYVKCTPYGYGLEPAKPSEHTITIAEAWDADSGELHGWLKATLTSDKYSASTGFHPELAVTGAQYNIAKVLAEGHPLIHETPAWIGNQDMASLWEEIYEAVTLLFMTKPGDFLLLHLITSLHAMEQITNQIPVNQQKHAIKCYWTAMLGIIFSRGDIPTRASLEALHSKYKEAVDHDENTTKGQEWEHIVARALIEEEEHNPKLVYVQRLLWKRFGQRSLFRVAAGNFTTTLEIPKTEEKGSTS